MCKFAYRYIKKSVFLSVLYSFFFVNGIVYILDTKLGYFDIVHSTVLRNIESAYNTNEKKPYSHSSDSIVILISNTLFEKEFNAQTPLDKDLLSVLVESILEQNPKNLILDLDISPDYNFTQQYGSINQHLYSTLINYSQQTNIFLPFAFIAHTHENKTLKHQWFQYMCQNNINFGFPFIFNEIGSVLQYKDYSSHIALSAFNADKANQTCLQTIDSFKEINSIIEKNILQYNMSDSIPINYQMIDESTLLLNNFNELKKYNFADKTIFLGGGYGFNDIYITPNGEKFGVEILNSIYYTLGHKIDHDNVLMTLIIFDLILGLTFGMLIKIVLNARAKSSLQSRITFYNLLALFIMVIYFIISLRITAYLFHNLYLWLNPIPLLIGMFIDAIIGLGEKESSQKNDKYIYIVHAIKATLVVAGVHGLCMVI